MGLIEQHVFILSLNIQGTTEKVSQFLCRLCQYTTKMLVLMDKNVLKHIRKVKIIIKYDLCIYQSDVNKTK